MMYNISLETKETAFASGYEPCDAIYCQILRLKA